jgi:hypothetical protein
MRDDLHKYADVVRMWAAKFDTQSIAERTGLPECLVDRWVWNFRQQMREVASA